MAGGGVDTLSDAALCSIHLSQGVLDQDLLLHLVLEILQRQIRIVGQLVALFSIPTEQIAAGETFVSRDNLEGDSSRTVFLVVAAVPVHDQYCLARRMLWTRRGT
jgi:hypothetical protein